MADTEKAHSLFAPSGAEARALCVGKLAMEKGLPDISSEYADEGTAAHTVGSTALIENKNAIDYLGWKLSVQGSSNSPVREFENDETMAGFIQTYLDAVRTYAVDCVYMAVEERVNFARFIDQPEEDSFGTGDVILITNNFELQLHDLKYGMGVKVYAERNAQLLHYALGAYDFLKYFYRIDSIRLVIHQPRLYWLDEWPCSIEQMLQEAEIFKENAKIVRQLYECAEALPIEQLRKFLKAGEKQCMFCKAYAHCPEARDSVTHLLAANFQSFDLMSTEPTPRVDLNKLGQAMDGVGFVEGWCKSVRAEVERELLANRAPIGIAGPYKLVKGRKGKRRFKDLTEVLFWLSFYGLTHEEIYNYKMRSPTEIESRYKPKRKRPSPKPGLWESLQEFIEQPDGTYSVAPANDEREALVIKSNNNLLSEYFTQEDEE